MGSNPQSSLPDDLLAKIVKIVADQCWWYLGAVIRSGRRGRDIINHPGVLKDAKIFSLCSDPENFHCKGYDQNNLAGEGRCRSFFQKCLDQENPTAIYYEGLRLAVHAGNINGAIDMLHKIILVHGNATLAAGILSACAGNGDTAAFFLQKFHENHHHLSSEDTRDVGEELIMDFRSYGPSYNHTYRKTFNYPMTPFIRRPKCAIKCAMANGPHNNTCNNCFIWWCTRRINVML